MNTFLKKWTILINETVCPYHEAIERLSEEEIEAIVHESAEEVENVRNSLVDYLVNNPSIGDKQQFVKVNQAQLIRLLDKLYSCRNDNVPEKVLILYKALGSHLQASLDFIEDFFGNYFDKNEKVPVAYLDITKSEIARGLKKLTFVINSGCVDQVLAKAILQTIKLFSSGKVEKNISYTSLSYHRVLLDELISQKPMSTQTIRKTLYQLNFNEVSFVNFEFERLHALIESAQRKAEKIAILRFEQKTIAQYPEKLNTVYDSSMAALKEQVNGWIEAEIKFLENGHAAEKDYPTNTDTTEKINTSLSVAKLALIIRLLVVDKIIINRTVAPMLRVISKMVTTLQKDEISFGSLETKYHAPDKATITAVRDMLFKWINILGKL
jgi:hypothetical protein